PPAYLVDRFGLRLARPALSGSRPAPGQVFLVPALVFVGGPEWRLAVRRPVQSVCLPGTGEPVRRRAGGLQRRRESARGGPALSAGGAGRLARLPARRGPDLRRPSLSGPLSPRRAAHARRAGRCSRGPHGRRPALQGCAVSPAWLA